MSKKAIIEQYILSLGVSPSERGYHYLLHAIYLAVEDRELLHCVTSRIYPETAQYFSTSSSNVEKAITRQIKDMVWNEDNRTMLHLSQSEADKPLTNAKLIAQMSRAIALKLNEKE